MAAAAETRTSIPTDIKIGTLKDELASALPDGFHCRVRYVHSPPKLCDPLFSPPQGTEPEKTRLASHFLTVSTKRKSAADSEESGDVVFLGIEALVYSTKHVTTIFVSKADSTGYLPQQRPSPVKAIATTFLRWLTAKERQKHPTRKLVISLFARSQTQYLFPGSADNTDKHVLDDRQLIKWWARVLDPLIPKSDELDGPVDAHNTEYDGYVTVPGYSATELRPFMPSSGLGSRWHPGDPLLELAQTREISTAAPPRCLLPRFPDDPKARFMQDLDNEMGISEDVATISPSKRKGGKWNSIRDLDRFWEAMEFRQECSSGRVVGFLWLVVRSKASTQEPPQLTEELLSQETSQESSLGAPYSDIASQREESVSVTSSPSKKRRKPLSGFIVPRQPRLKGGSSSRSGTSDLTSMLNGASGEGLVLSKEGYEKAMQRLLHLDFSDLKVAIQSTSKWVSEVSGICGIKNDWSLEVLGTAKPEVVASNTGSNGSAQVNDLGGVIRKKRKADDPGSAIVIAPGLVVGTPNPGVNVLSGGMIRKKAKPAAT